jgi:hypothetical protein
MCRGKATPGGDSNVTLRNCVTMQYAAQGQALPGGIAVDAMGVYWFN